MLDLTESPVLLTACGFCGLICPIVILTATSLTAFGYRALWWFNLYGSSWGLLPHSGCLSRLSLGSRPFDSNH